MSLTNRYPVHGSTSDPLRYSKSHAQTPTRTKPWTVLMFKPADANPTLFLDLELDIDTQTLAVLRSHLDIESIVIHAPHTHHLAYSTFITQFGASISNLPHRSSILELIQEQLLLQHNCIVLGRGCGWLTADAGMFASLETSNQAYAYYTLMSQASPSYQQIGSKLKLESIIDSKLLVLPWSIANQQFVTDALVLAAGLTVSDPQQVADLALTLALRRSPTTLKPTTELNQSSISYLSSPIDRNHTREQSQTFTPNPLAYYNPDYIFYPYLDLDLVPTDSTLAYSTKGSTYDPPLALFSTAFTRFTDSNQGLLIHRGYNKTTPRIPSVLHYVWLDADINREQTDLWTRALPISWELKVWDTSSLATAFGSSRWLGLLSHITDQQLRWLAVSSMLIEAVGGLVIQAPSIPLHLDLDQLRYHDHIYTLSSDHDLSLCYRMIGGAPDTYSLENTQIDHSLATKFREFPGSKARVVTAPTANPVYRVHHYYAQLYQLLTTAPKTAIDVFILSRPETMCYPSYYCRPDANRYPSILSKYSLCAHLWPVPIRITPRERTPLVRTIRTTPVTLAQQLIENPRDRLKNERK